MASESALFTLRLSLNKFGAQVPNLSSITLSGSPSLLLGRKMYPLTFKFPGRTKNQINMRQISMRKTYESWIIYGPLVYRRRPRDTEKLAKMAEAFTGNTTHSYRQKKQLGVVSDGRLPGDAQETRARLLGRSKSQPSPLIAKVGLVRRGKLHSGNFPYIWKWPLERVTFSCFSEHHPCCCLLKLKAFYRFWNNWLVNTAQPQILSNCEYIYSSFLNTFHHTLQSAFFVFGWKNFKVVLR